MTNTRRIVVAVSGASGAIYGIRSLKALRADPSVEIHAIVSKGARATIEYETSWKVADVLALAHVQYDENDLAAALASGTFMTAGMLVAPCSIRTMSAIAHSMSDNLTMHELALYGATILPPVPGFYILPKTIDDLVDHSVGKALDQLGVAHDLFPRWSGPKKA